MRMQVYVLSVCLLAPVFILADFSNDVFHISQECLPALHPDAINGSLLTFAKRNHLTDEEMAERLLFIADPANGFTDCVGRSQTRAALGGLCNFRDAFNAIPDLEKYISNPETRSESLCACGYLTKYSNHFFVVTKKLVGNGTLDEPFFLGFLRSVIRCHKSGHYLLGELSKKRMERILVTGKATSFEDAVHSDLFLCENTLGYTNCVEHLHAEERILELLHNRGDQIVKKSYYRREWGGSAISDEEWYRRVTNSCQSEIARVMSLPEGERLNLTAILDAQIAALEEEEARAARHAVWRQRFRLGTFFILPALCLAFAVLFVLKKKRSLMIGCPSPGE